MSCLDYETLVAYWAHDLDAARLDEAEEHLFACDRCTATSARIAAVTERIRTIVPMVVMPAMVDALRAKGHRVEESIAAPGERSRVVFAGQDFIIVRLTGLPLADAERVALSLREEGTDAPIAEIPSAPFEPGAGEVLIACQRHFSVFPRNVAFHVTTTARGGARQEHHYVVEHEFR